ncbi:MAG: flagellar hook-length control protein FliK [Bacilli bacterium]
MSIELSPSGPPSAKKEASVSASKRGGAMGTKNRVKSPDWLAAHVGQTGHAGQAAEPFAQGAGIFVFRLAMEERRAARSPARASVNAQDMGAAARQVASNSHRAGGLAANAAPGGTGSRVSTGKAQGSHSALPVVHGKQPAGAPFGRLPLKPAGDGVAGALPTSGRRMPAGIRGAQAMIRGTTRLRATGAQPGIVGASLGARAPQKVQAASAALSGAGSGAGNPPSLSGSGGYAAHAAARQNAVAAALSADGRTRLRAGASGSEPPAAALAPTALRTAVKASAVGVPAAVLPGAAAAVRGATQAVRAHLRRPSPRTGVHLRRPLPRAGVHRTGVRGRGRVRTPAGASAGGSVAALSGTTGGPQESGATSPAAVAASGIGAAMSAAGQSQQGGAHAGGSRQQGEGSPGAVAWREPSGLEAPALQSLLMQRFAPDVAGWLMQQSARVLGSGFAAVELTLVPEHLGKLRVTVTGDKATGLRVRFALANHEAQALVQSQLPELRQLLHTEGYGSVAIDVGAYSGGSSAQGKHDLQQPHSARGQSGAVSTALSGSAYTTQRDSDHAGFTARA